MTSEEGAAREQRRRVGDEWLLPADAAALELRRQDWMVTQRDILLDSYRHALTQARVSFWIAVAFSTAGSVILLGLATTVSSTLQSSQASRGRSPTCPPVCSISSR